MLFIHGLWINAGSWDSWVEEFDDNGYDSINYRWPGETARSDRRKSSNRPASAIWSNS